MRFIKALPLAALILMFLANGTADGQELWPMWRGPFGNGVAAGKQQPVTQWSAEKSIVWRAPVPGRGHASPVIMAGKIFLTTADEVRQTQSVVCYDQQAGTLQWNRVLNEGGFEPRIHSKNTHASPTVAATSDTVYAVFPHHDAVQLAALDFSGNIRWSIKAGGFVPRAYKFGYAPSPTIHEDQIIVASEFEAAGFIAAFDLKTGQERWRTARPPMINYSSPIVAQVAGKSQLLLSGGGQVAGYDPRTGQLKWSVPGLWDVTCGTMIWEHDLVFASGGFPASGTMAVRVGQSAEVVWQNQVKCYEQSMLVHEGYLYAVSDAGVAYCWRARDGVEQWKQRLGGAFSASPILVGETIYVTNEAGTTYVFAARPDRYQEIARNRLGDEAFATPAVCNDRIYTRIAVREGNRRQEYLVCIGAAR